MILMVRRALFALFGVALVMSDVALPKSQACLVALACGPRRSYVGSIIWLSLAVAALVAALVLRRQESNSSGA